MAQQLDVPVNIVQDFLDSKILLTADHLRKIPALYAEHETDGAMWITLGERYQRYTNRLIPIFPSSHR